MNTGVKAMKRPLALLILALLLASLLAAGCGAQPYDPPTPIPTLPPATMPAEEPTEAPAAATAPTEEAAGEAAPTEGAAGEAAGGEDVLAAGAEVFQQNCAACHNLTTEALVGPGLAGLFGMAGLPNGNPVNEDNLREWIRNGGGAMPGIPLTDEQLDVLIPYLEDATQ
jgi:mono/diheme cytochrome c family protein